MSRKTISQAEARALRRRVEELETLEKRRRSTYAADYPGTHLGTVSWDAASHVGSAVYTARRLGHAVVAIANGTQRFDLYALPHPDVPV